MAKLFHGILFGYQKAIGAITSKAGSIVFDDQVVSFLDAAFKDDPFLTIIEGDPKASLLEFKKFLEEAGLVKNVVVDSKFNGYSFEIKDCIFAEEVHAHLDTEDLMCPYAIVAHYIVSKASGHPTRKSLSKFTETSSLSYIDY